MVVMSNDDGLTYHGGDDEMGAGGGRGGGRGGVVDQHGGLRWSWRTNMVIRHGKTKSISGFGFSSTL